MSYRFWSLLKNVLRELSRRPTFGLSVVLILALAFASTTAMLSVVYAVLIKPQPYADAERVLVIGHNHSTRGEVFGAYSPDDYRDLQARTRTLSSVASYLFWPGQVSVNAQIADRATQLETAYVSGNFFSTLGVQAAQGRLLSISDDVAQPQHLVLSHAAWRQLLQSDPQAVGRTLLIDGNSFSVVGVLPPGFDYPDPQVQIYLPQSYITEDMIPHRRGVRWLELVGRAQSEVSHAAVGAELGQIVADLHSEYPDSNEGFAGAVVAPIVEHHTGAHRAPLGALLAATLLVLLIACVNLANLMLARMQRMSQQMATLSAIGASARHLAARVMAESLLLSGAGALLGLLFAHGLLQLWAAQSAVVLPRQEEIGLALPVLLGGVLLSLLTGIGVGLLPAWRVQRMDVSQILTRGGAAAATPGQARLRSALVVVQIAIMSALAYTTLLATESLRHLAEVDSGVNADQVLNFKIKLQGGRYDEQGVSASVRGEILQSLSEISGVLSVAGSKNLPIGETGERYKFSDPLRPNETIAPAWGVQLVTPHYFQTLGVTRLQGEDFPSGQAQSALSLIVNRAFVERYYPGEEVVGRRLQLGQTPIQIIGVVENIRHAGLRMPAEPTAYAQLALFPRSSLVVSLRVNRTDPELAEQIRLVVAAVDPGLPIVGLQKIADFGAQMESKLRLATVALSGFATLAAMICALGVFSLLSFVVGERRFELALKLAIGANPRRLFGEVMLRALRWTLLGLLIGGPVAVAVARALRAQWFGLDPLEPALAATLVVAVLCVALLAALLPAIRALNTDPASTIRR